MAIYQPQQPTPAPAKKGSWFARHKVITGVAGFLLVVGIASAAAGGDDPQTAAQQDDSRSSTNTAKTDSSDTDDDAACLKPSKVLLRDIADGMEPGTNVTVKRGIAVRSKDFPKVWMVAVELAGPGLKGTKAVFTTNSLAGEGVIMAVGAMSQEFSVYPDADKTTANATQSTHGYDEALGCL